MKKQLDFLVQYEVEFQGWQRRSSGKFTIWRWLFHQLTVGTKKWFSRPPVMSFGFFDVIFGGKGLEIDTYEPPNFIWSYHTHMVNTCWPKWPRAPKSTFLSNFDVKNSIKSSWNDDIFRNFCFQDWKWNKHHKFDTSPCVQMFQNIQNILFTFFDIFSLIVCYFDVKNA